MTVKKSLILFGIIAGIALLTLLLRNGNGASAVTETSSGRLVAETTMHDFGTISMGAGDVMQEYIVRNTGDDTLTITKAYTSCMCTVANVVDPTGKRSGAFGMPGHGPTPKANITLAPGETATVEAVFDPAAHGPSGVGLAERTVYLETNSTATPTMELSFRAMVTR